MKSNNRKTAVLGSGSQEGFQRSAAEPGDKVEDAVRVPYTESATDTQELLGTAEAPSVDTPSPRSPRRDEHGTFPAAARIPRESDDDDDDDVGEQDEDEDDDQEEDEVEEEDADDDERNEIVMEFEEAYGVAYADANYDLDDTEEDPAPTTVPDDDPEVLALLRSLSEGAADGRALAGHLDKHHDPRAPAVRALTSAQPVFPATNGELPEEFTIVATDQWHVTAKHNGCDADVRMVITISATAYCGTDLAKGMVNYGDHERFQGMQLTYKVCRGEWERETIRAAFDCLRLRLVCRLFNTSPEEVNCPPDELVALRARRYAELLREPHSEAADYVCEMIKHTPPLQEALLAALAEHKADRLIWHGLMDHLNPGWRRQVVFKPATSQPKTRPA